MATKISDGAARPLADAAAWWGPALSRSPLRDAARERRRRPRPGRIALLTATLMFLAVAGAVAAAAVPGGVWLVDGKAAVQIFDCDGLLCGRILWLATPRDPQGELNRDRKNPDPALRRRRLCGLTVLWGLRPIGPDRWGGGRFYNPDDGKTYNVSAELRSADLILARLYVGLPLLGETKTLLRVRRGNSQGWC